MLLLWMRLLACDGWRGEEKRRTKVLIGDCKRTRKLNQETCACIMILDPEHTYCAYPPTCLQQRFSYICVLGLMGLGSGENLTSSHRSLRFSPDKAPAADVWPIRTPPTIGVNRCFPGVGSQTGFHPNPFRISRAHPHSSIGGYPGWASVRPGSPHIFPPRPTLPSGYACANGVAPINFLFDSNLMSRSYLTSEIHMHGPAVPLYRYRKEQTTRSVWNDL